MAAFIQSQAFAKPSCLSHSVLRKNSNASKFSIPFCVLNPNICLRRLPFCPSAHLKSSSSSSKWTFEKMAMQRRTLQNRRMAFAGEATAGNAEEEEEPKQGEIDFSRPFRAMEAPPKPIDYRPWIAGFALLFFLFRDVIVHELVYWLKLAVLGLDFLIEKVVVVLYTLLKPLVPLAAVVTTGTAWATVIVNEVYGFLINMTSVRAFTEAIVLSSAVLGIGEATKANAVSCQPYTIGLAGFLGLGAVLGLLPSSIFVALLLALVSFSLMVKKRDMVSSIMPLAAVLAAVAEPWVRAFAMVSFLALALHQNWKSPEKEQAPLDNGIRYKVQPIIILRVLSLMVGITVAAEWLYFRHLIWLAK